MSDTHESPRPWIVPVLAALVMVGGLAAAAWPGLDLPLRIGGGFLAGVAALVLGRAVLIDPAPWRRLATGLVPGVMLAVILAMAMPSETTVSPGQRSAVVDAGSVPAPAVDTLDELYAQALTVADELVPGGATSLRHIRLYTDVHSAGSRVHVSDGEALIEARLETHPERAWHWEKTITGTTPRTFDGHQVTLAFAPVVTELGARAEGVGITPAFETVWIDPGQDTFQPLAAANPERLPVLQFNSRVQGRELHAQALGDGTLPDTFFDVRDQAASLRHIRDALEVDGRSASTAELQLLTARTPTDILQGPIIDGRPHDGGVQFRGRVDGDFLEVTVAVGRFPTIHDRTPDDTLSYHPLSDLPEGLLGESITRSEHPVAWQLRAEQDGLRLRYVDSPAAAEQSVDL